MILFLIALLPLNGALLWHQPLCSESFLLDNGFSYGYLEHIAHRIHSLTLEDLQFYFEANATENNFVPTVNLNMSTFAAERVLAHAPISGHYTGFNTIGLNILDKVLRHMDREEWGLTGYNKIEKIVHAFHMADMWQTISEVYNSMEDPGEAVCGCINDVKNNGLWQAINKLALEIKYPGITSGEEDALQTGRVAKREAHHGSHAHEHPHSPKYTDCKRRKRAAHHMPGHDGGPEDCEPEHQIPAGDHAGDHHHGDHVHPPGHVYSNGHAGSDSGHGDGHVHPPGHVYSNGHAGSDSGHGQAFKRSAKVRSLKKRTVKRSPDWKHQDKDSVEQLLDFDFSVADAELLEKAAKELTDGTKAQEARIVDEEGWFAWRDELIQFGGTDLFESSNKDAALFLYCTLKYKME